MKNKNIDETEICPICRRPYSDKNSKVKYHLQYSPISEYIFACKSCNYAEYLSRHWPNHLKPWYWYKIYLVRNFNKKNQGLIRQ